MRWLNKSGFFQESIAPMYGMERQLQRWLNSANGSSSVTGEHQELG